MILFSRGEWGAQHGRGTEKRGARSVVVLHHFASPHVDCGATLEGEREAVQGVERHHAVTKGWAGIGYNFVVFQSGHIYEGRGWERIGAHAAGHNSTSYGIALAIDGRTHSATRAAVQAVRDLIDGGIRAGHIAPDYTLRGHRDLGQTTCPGELVYRHLQTFRHDA
jgi:N-acetylmuramoyl-L-alanine amidase